jgi:hypothetical protein
MLLHYGIDDAEQDAHRHFKPQTGVGRMRLSTSIAVDLMEPGEVARGVSLLRNGVPAGERAARSAGIGAATSEFAASGNCMRCRNNSRLSKLMKNWTLGGVAAYAFLAGSGQ